MYTLLIHLVIDFLGKFNLKEISSTVKKPSKNYTCFILRRFGLYLIHLQSKYKLLFFD